MSSIMHDISRRHFVSFAKILKSNGTDGGVLVSSPEVDLESVEDPVWLYFDGLPVPFFVRECTRKGDVRYVVHFADVENLDDAQELVGRELFLEGEDFSGEEGAESFIGWEVYNIPDDSHSGDAAPSASGSPGVAPSSGSGDMVLTAFSRDARLSAGSPGAVFVGTLTDIEDIPGNPCIYVKTAAGTTVMLPLHPDLIVRLDPDFRRLTLRLPDGLLR